MRTILHIGPHKTGTTSVQRWLLDLHDYHILSSAVYYPIGYAFGPGHALLAWEVLGLNGKSLGISSLRKAYDEAYERGASTVVLSSEEFSRGLFDSGSFGDLLNFCVSKGDVQVVSTLTPLPVRFFSELAEHVKHRGVVNLSHPELVEFSTFRPGLKPDFPIVFSEAFNGIPIDVVLTKKDNPYFVVERLAEIIGIPVPEKSYSINRRHDDSTTAMMNFINQHYNGSIQNSRDAATAADALIKASGLTFQEFDKNINFERYLNDIWNMQLSFFELLQELGRCRLHK